MSRFYSHVNTAKAILSKYKGEMPFSTFLKSFFAGEKKYGSRDRRTIGTLCYNYFRLEHALKRQNVEDKMIASVFLSSEEPNDFLEKERPEWNSKAGTGVDEKLQIIAIEVEEIFPFNAHLSEGIDPACFDTSFLMQPELFLRIRPGRHASVRDKLQRGNIAFQEVSKNCFAFANGTKLEALVDINKDAVVQDLNSQRVGELMPVTETSTPQQVWDCCAASGGKSIMAVDVMKNIELTVSDVRQSILHNLHNRFKAANIKGYHSFVVDVTNASSLQSAIGTSTFDLIICDAPCSGSGTWARTPEQLPFFKEEEIARYSNLQKQIAGNSIRFLHAGGFFLYVTCSVFKEENEEVVASILQQNNVELIKMELLKGYEIKADTMFAALFRLN
jgi:16S rRNA (cytosine967-C5)-methyltransferase